MECRPNRSDVHLSKEEEVKIEEETRDYFDGIAPKRHTKPQRSEYSSNYFDALPNNGGNNADPPELAEFQRLETDPQKLVYDGSKVTEEFVETEYYQDLNCIDKQHHTVRTSNHVCMLDENNLMEVAYKLYSQTTKKRFKFEHTWNTWRLLRNEPKWKGESMDNSSKRSKTYAGTYSSSSNPYTPVSCGEYDPSIPIDRSIGQKAAKKKSKASAPPAVDMTTMEDAVVEKNIAMTKIVEAKLAECKVKEAESIPALYEILMKDVSAMDEAQRKNHYFCCEIIKRKLGLM